MKKQNKTKEINFNTLHAPVRLSPPVGLSIFFVLYFRFPSADDLKIANEIWQINTLLMFSLELECFHQFNQLNVFESCFSPFRVMLSFINVPGGN